MELPKILLDELFDINFPTQPLVIDQFIEHVETYHNIDVLEYENFDHAITIQLENSRITAEIRVDKIKRNFTICAKCKHPEIGLFLPISGDWLCIMMALDSLEILEQPENERITQDRRPIHWP